MFTRSVFSLGAIISLAWASHTSAAVILQDNFDSYADQAAFEAAWGVVGALPSGVLSTAQSVTPPNSIHNPGTTVNAEAKRNQRIFAETGLADIATDNVIRFSFDFFDSNSAVQPFRHHTNLQDGTGASASGQLIAMGMNNNQLASASGGNYYMGRILGYDPPETPAADPGAFFKLNEPGAPLRSTGWHKLAVDISEIDYRFFVDGILSEVVPNTFTLRSYDVVRLGSGLSNAGNEAFYDNVLVETIHQIRPSIWNFDADENWSSVLSWTGEVPNSVGAEAVLGSVITAPRSITLDSPVTIGRLTLQNENAYTIAGPGRLTLDASAGPTVIHAVSGSHVISAPVTLADNTVIAVASAAGNLSLTGALDAGGVSLTKSGPGTLTANNIRAKELVISGGTVTTTPGGGTSVLGSLSVAGGATPTAKLDLNNNAAIVDYPAAGPSPAATIRDQIIAGRGGTGLGKPWNGAGITSSTAQADVAASPNSRSIGYAVNADLPLGALTTFRGQAVDPSSVLIRYTRTADANLDGVVNDDDVTVVGTFYAPGVSKPEWAKGDFDYNGFVDDDDVTLLGVFYNPSATPIPSPAAEAAAGASVLAAVPEPASVVILALGCLVLLPIAKRTCFTRTEGPRWLKT